MINIHESSQDKSARQSVLDGSTGRPRLPQEIDIGENQNLRKLFDASWYINRYPEVAATGLDPLVHFIERGSAAGYDPHPMFCTAWYLDHYPDIAAAGINPFVHYVVHGAFEGRDPHPLFDTRWYLEHYPDVVGTSMNPLVHFVEIGASEGRQPGPLFSIHNNWEGDHRVAAADRAQYEWERFSQPGAKSTEMAQDKSLARLSMVTLTRWAKTCYSYSLFFLASLLLRLALRCSSTGQEEALALLSKCEIRRKRYDQAFAWFLRRSGLVPPPNLRVHTEAMPAIFQSRTKCQNICVVTSVMPRRIKAQQAALRSWLAAGLSVISVNSASEATEVREHFPDITFRIVENPIIDIRGRPFIPIQALMQAANDVSADICGIINSDIEFRGTPAFFDVVRREISGSLVFGNRIDFDNSETTHGSAFRNGYDFFFWERINSCLFEETPMALGLPWWDFWLPLHAHAQGLKIKRIVTSSFVHYMHPIGYNLPAFVKFGHLCAVALASVYSRWGSHNVPADRSFLHHLFATASTLQIDQLPDSVVRRVGVVCDMCNCLIDSIAKTVTLPDAKIAAKAMDLV